MTEAKLTRFQWIVAVVLVGVVLLPIWTPKHFPSQNGPEYLLLAHMTKEWKNPEFDYSDNYRLVFVAVPNITAQAAIYGLSHIMPVETAWRLTLSLGVIALPLSVFYFLRRFAPQNYLMGFVVFPFLFNYYLLKGYDNFYLSLSFFFLFFGYLAKSHENMRWRDALVLCALLMLTYFSHVFSFCVACMLAPIYFGLMRNPWSRLSKAIAIFLPTTILFVQYFFFARSLSGEMVSEGGEWLLYPPLRLKIVRFFQFLMYSVWEPASYVFLGLVAAPLLVLWLWQLRNTTTEVRTRQEELTVVLRRRMPMFLSVVVVLAYFVAPHAIAGWPKFFERFLPFVLVFIAASAYIGSSRWFRASIISLTAAATLVLAIGIGFTVHRTSQQVADYLSGIPHVARNGKLLAVYTERFAVGRIHSLRWAFNYYNIDKGGVTGESVVQYPGRVPMRYRYDRKTVLPTFRLTRDGLAALPGIAGQYDNIIVWGEVDELHPVLIEVGFHLVHRQGKLHVYGPKRGVQGATTTRFNTGTATPNVMGKGS